MPEPARRNLYTIRAARGFADALAAGLIERHGRSDDPLALARLTLLLPSRRAVRSVTEAFVRLSGDGLLLPRMAVVGDLDLDETLGALLDPLGAARVPPAADPVRRWLRLARILDEVEGPEAPKGAALLRRAYEIGGTMDRLLVEGLTPIEVFDKALGVAPEMAAHFRENTRLFLSVQQHWIAELARRGEVDAPERRNRLFAHMAERWRETPPAGPVVAAGVTSASPALARLLRVVSALPQGCVVLPDLDLDLDEDVWRELGRAGAPVEDAGEVAGEDTSPFGPGDATSHPQYHLKLLLNRMGVARGEVAEWPRGAKEGPARPEGRAVANLFLPPQASARWVELPARERRLEAVRLMIADHPGEEAQAIALLLREALEVPERRVALVTPDRGLARRVALHLSRWGIEADDSAGRPLAETAAGRLFLLLAEVLSEQAAPVPLVALLTHPLVAREATRGRWLAQARRLDRELRGPRPVPGLEPLAQVAEAARVDRWWHEEVAPVLAPLFADTRPAGQGMGPADGAVPLDDLVDRLVAVGEGLCGEALWTGADGRALSAMVEDLREGAREAGTAIAPRDLAAVLRDVAERTAVRPPWGGHPRIAIYGLLEARMTRADLVVCGGLVEGTWPASPATDALLPPAVLRALGVPGADFRIGLAAHDLAAALGAPEVVLSRARRDEGGPVIASRFVLRIEAMLGPEEAARHRDQTWVELARRIDDADPVPPHPRPQPMPSADQRLVDVSVTGLDRLRGDPYQFYAGSILGLRSLDALDAEPSAAWKGEVAHRILELWHAAGEPPDDLESIARATLVEKNAHPLMRGLWWPRLAEALGTFRDRVLAEKAQGRRPVLWEAWGEMRRQGVRVHGRIDRLDRLADGGLAVVDYKTGKPPSLAQVEEGFALQLGVLGLIAEAGGFEGAAGEATAFEYWSFGKKRGELGYVESPVDRDGKGKGIAPEAFLPHAATMLDDALGRWILGSEPFTARLNPDLGGYNDYDQLMRLDEWVTTLGSRPAGDAAEGGA